MPRKELKKDEITEELARSGLHNSHRYPFLQRPLGNSILNCDKFIIANFIPVERGLVHFRSVCGEGCVAYESERHVLQLERQRKMESIFAVRDCIQQFMLADAAISTSLMKSELFQYVACTVARRTKSLIMVNLTTRLVIVNR